MRLSGDSACCPLISALTFSFRRMTDHNITTAKLLALLNASATLPKKRKRRIPEVEVEPVRLNKRRPVATLDPIEASTTDEHKEVNEISKDTDATDKHDDVEELDAEATHPDGGRTSGHFSNHPVFLTPRTLDAISPPGEHSRVKWKIQRRPLGAQRCASVFSLEDKDGEMDVAVLPPLPSPPSQYAPRFWNHFETRMKERPERE